jgi:proteasome lid subunit RPN8/RPN11
MPRKLELKARDWESMRSHVETCRPFEACGLLAGRDGFVERVFPVPNASQSPTRFRMDAAAQLSAFRDLEELGLELLGIFHSHPRDNPDDGAVLAGPSETDVQEAAYPVVHVIWSRREGQWQANGFWIEQGTILEVPLVIRVGE